MSIQPQSTLVDTLEQGLILDVQIEDLQFTAYVVISAPDINLVADFVPAEQFEQDGDVHVTAVSHPDEVRTQIQDLAFNMNMGDAAVFLCGNAKVYQQTLEELGHQAPDQLN